MIGPAKSQESLPQVLGSGYNGEVKLARCKTTGAKFAVKAFKLRGVSKEKRKDSAYIQILAQSPKIQLTRRRGNGPVIYVASWVLWFIQTMAM